MADYPTLRIAPGSEWEYIDDMVVDRSVAGDARGRSYFPSAKRRFNVKHMDLSPTDHNTLTTFYGTWRALTFTFVWIDGVTYTVMFATNGKPKFSAPYGVLRYDVAVILEEA